MSPTRARIRSTIASVVDIPDDLRELRRFHKVLADANRLRIVRRLSDGPATVTELIEHVGLSQPLVSWHLGKLREVGLVTSRRQGRETVHTIVPEAFESFASRQARALGLTTGARGAGRLVSGSLVSPETRARVRGLMTPIAVGLGRLGLSPNALTIIGFLIACVAAIAAGLQSWIVAGLLVVFGGVFDLFDGALARATGKVSKLGAFMDSTFDRWGEGVVYLGILWGALELGYSLPVVLTGAAMVSAFMVSYTRAKSESLGFVPGTGMANVGLAPREIRIVILTLGLLGAGIAGTSAADTGGSGLVATPLGVLILDAALGLIAVLATITVIQRIVATINQASKPEQG